MPKQSDPVELVNLRDDSGKPIDYRDNGETKRVRGILEQMNRVTEAALVQYFHPKSKTWYRLETRLCCIYNRNLQLGGRFYTRDRDGYQHLSEQERSCIHIDGEPTVELDYSGLQPRILYAWEGIQYDDDPYGAVEGDPLLREMIKHLFLAVLNSACEARAVRTGYEFLLGHREQYCCLRKRGLTLKDHLLPRLKKVHLPISKYFFTETGLRVMNLDAKIALDVIAPFTDDEIPVLAIHDSFIVQSRLKDRLRKAMENAYSCRTGGFRCPVRQRGS